MSLLDIIMGKDQSKNKYKAFDAVREQQQQHQQLEQEYEKQRLAHELRARKYNQIAGIAGTAGTTGIAGTTTTTTGGPWTVSPYQINNPGTWNQPINPIQPQPWNGIIDKSPFGINKILNSQNLISVILVRTWEENLMAQEGDIVLALDTNKYYRCTVSASWYNPPVGTSSAVSSVTNIVQAQWEEIQILDLTDKMGIQTVAQKYEPAYINPAVNKNDEEVKEVFDAFEKNLKFEPEKDHRTIGQKLKGFFSPESEPPQQAFT